MRPQHATSNALENIYSRFGVGQDDAGNYVFVTPLGAMIVGKAPVLRKILLDTLLNLEAREQADRDRIIVPRIAVS